MKTDPTAKRVLLVVRHAETLSEEDRIVQQRLERLGHPVIAEEDTRAKPANYALVVLSSAVGAPNLSPEFRTADVPIVVLGEAVYADLGMTARNINGGIAAESAFHYGRAAGQHELVIISPWHSMAAGLKLKVCVASESSADMIWARPKASAVKVATLVSKKPINYKAIDSNPQADRERPVLFGYEKGAEMAGQIAPGRRVGLFFDHQMVLNLNNNGWALFDAAIKWAVGEELKQFAEVFQEEWQEITERRQRQRIELKPTDSSAPRVGAAAASNNGHARNNGGGTPPPVSTANASTQAASTAAAPASAASTPTPPPTPVAPKPESDARHAPPNLTGLALSGGGIRSATFCLGLLQGLERQNVLRVFDYLSTVSGGGYMGGWWSAWLAREGLDAHVRSAYPLLGVNDVKCLSTLCRTLLDDNNLISLHLTERLFATPGTEDLVKRLCLEPNPGHDDAKALVNELNKLLPPPCIFDAEAFNHHGIKLTTEVKELLRGVQQGANGDSVARLNRLLLEHAFPKQISSSIFPPDEQIEPARVKYFSLMSARNGGRDGKSSESGTEMMCAGHDPLHHLRLFANYLTPRKGLLSGDTWRAIAVISRNLLLNWLTLLPLLVTFMLLGQLFFVLRPPMPPDAAVPALSEQMAYFGFAAKDTEALNWDPSDPVKWQEEVRAGYKHDFIFPYWSLIAEHNEQTATLNARLAQKKGESQKNTEDISNLEKQVKQSAAKAEALSVAHNESLRQRIIYAAIWCALIYALVVFMSAVWMVRNTSGSSMLGWFGAITFWLLTVILSLAFLKDQTIAGMWNKILNPSATLQEWAWHIGGVAAWFAVGVGLWVWAWKGGSRADAAALGQNEESRKQWRREVQRNRTTRAHTQLLILLAVMAGVLALAGFGYEIFNYAVHSSNQWLARVGGGLTLLTAIIGAVYTAIKTSPVGGGDDNLSKGTHPSLKTRIIFAFTPPLVVIVLAVAASTLAQALISYIASDTHVRLHLMALTIATFATIILCLTFSAAEVGWRKGLPKIGITVVSLLSLAFGFLAYWLSNGSQASLKPFWPLGIALLSGCLILARLAVDEAQSSDQSQRRSFRLLVFSSRWTTPFTARKVIAASLTAFVLGALVCLILGWQFPLIRRWLLDPREIAERSALVGATTGGLVFCLLFYLLGAWRGTGSNRRSLWLLGSVYVVLCVMLIFCFFPQGYVGYASVLLAHTVIGLISAALGIVIALGWLADPNSLSMHTFYKDRLVRAYLGASNHVRGWWAKDITESVEGDDVLLSQLRNCQRGAPYHLINTTLNLVAGRDLATVQRSSAMFVLSKRNCGSSRTGYRQTAKYMGGRLSLGTAIAISGAAASPNMGAHTLSASLAMLMAVLNVRLGYWAPTPYKQHWKLEQAQLWPFYTLRELVSQTNDLSSYCYLTDGGHFDNTGLYSLVERGCRYIVVADCAADPKPCFGDLGDVIRRCRIDFGAEITLDIDAFMKKKEEKHASARYVVGHITYSPEHVKRLNWSPEVCKEKDYLKGIIVLIKPALTADEKVDIRQYSLENENFPQQTTADQWFDEAQFESYRRLGELCAQTVFGELKSVKQLGDQTRNSKFRESHPISVKLIEEMFKQAHTASSGRKEVSAASQLEKRLWEVVQGALQTHGRQRTPDCDTVLKGVISGGVSVLDRMGYLPQHLVAAEGNLCVLARLMREEADKDGRFTLTPSDISAALATKRLFPFDPASTA